MNRHNNPEQDKLDKKYPLVQPVYFQDLSQNQAPKDMQEFLVIKRQIEEALRIEKQNYVNYSLDNNQQQQVQNITQLYQKYKISTCTQNFMNETILKYFKQAKQHQNHYLDLLVILRYAVKFCGYQQKPKYEGTFMNSLLGQDQTIININDLIKTEVIINKYTCIQLQSQMQNINNFIDQLNFSNYKKHDGERILTLMLKLQNINKREFTNFGAVINGTRDLSEYVMGKIKMPNSKIYLGCFVRHAKSIGYSVQWLSDFQQLMIQEKILKPKRIENAEKEINKFFEQIKPQFQKPISPPVEIYQKVLKRQKKDINSAIIIEIENDHQNLVTEVNDESSDYSQKSQLEPAASGMKINSDFQKANPFTFTDKPSQFQAPGQQILKFKYKQQLEEIKMMGFEFKDDLILDILDQQSGNLDRTIDKLINC